MKFLLGAWKNNITFIDLFKVTTVRNMSLFKYRTLSFIVIIKYFPRNIHAEKDEKHTEMLL